MRAPPTSDLQSQHFTMAAPETGLSAEALNTVHLYYEDTELFSCTAHVSGQWETEVEGEKRTVLILDRTVMHPQGGGQPADSGTISSPDGSIKFEVVHVQKPKGRCYIEHIGHYCSDTHFSMGDEVSVEIDGERRMLNARVHSAGHLLDSALFQMGHTDLEPSKGYHFSDGPYVEYIGNIPVEKRDQVLSDLNKEATRLVQEAIPVVVRINEKGERLVNVGGTECLCGGTHVKNTADIRSFTATKIKKNKKSIRVSYIVDK